MTVSSRLCRRTIMCLVNFLKQNIGGMRSLDQNQPSPIIEKLGDLLKRVCDTFEQVSKPRCIMLCLYIIRSI